MKYFYFLNIFFYFGLRSITVGDEGRGAFAPKKKEERKERKEHMHTHTRASRSRVDLQEVLELFNNAWVLAYLMA